MEDAMVIAESIVGAEAGRLRVDVGEAEVDERGGDVRSGMDEEAGLEVPSDGCVDGCVAVEEDVSKQPGTQSRDDGGRRKRKSRESGGGFLDNSTAKEDRKKRKDERERRKGRDGGDGSLKREHRESREWKESKRKEKKERRKHRDVKEEYLERPNNIERDGLVNRAGSENLVGEIVEHDAIVVEEEVGIAPSIPLDESLVGNSVGLDGLKGVSAAQVFPKSDELDDSKEEGEILDDESGGPVRGPESEAESGEIQTLDDAALASERMAGAADAVRDSPVGIERHWWRSPPAEASDVPLEHSMRARNGKISSKDAIEKSGQGPPQNPLQSVLGLAEAYESESPPSDERVSAPATRRSESTRHYFKEENGIRGSELSKLNRSGVEHTEENKKSRTSNRNESRSWNDLDTVDVNEQLGADRPKSLVRRHYNSPAKADRSLVEKDSRRRQSPSPMEALREKDARVGRSRSKERRMERGCSGSSGSPRRRNRSRRRTRSPELGRSARRARSPSLESVRDRRISRLESERRRRSSSRDSGAERRHSKDRAELHDRKRRSRSRESGRVRAVAREDSLDRRRRSRSRDSLRDRNHNGSRRADSIERRRRSRSRSIRERKIDDRLRSRHADDFGRRRRSRSRESLRERRLDDMDGGRHGRRGSDYHRSGRDDRSAQDGRQKLSGRDNIRRMDRDRDHGRNSQDRASRQPAREHSASDAVREEENQEEYQERVASQLAAQEEDDVERVKEESRRRRQAILEKYKKQKEMSEVEKPIFPEEGRIVNGIVPETRVDPSQTIPASAGSDVALALEKPLTRNGAIALPADEESGGLGAGTPKSERSSDMFCDDIFGESPAGGRRLGKGDGMTMDTSGLIDNWDDPDGYYCFRIGEVLDGRYEVASSHGKGVFSTVVRARDMKAGKGEPEEVAIKIIRNNETMYKYGQQELVILKKLAGADPENKRHCVRLLSSFEYRSHLCLVFESLHMNLREILKKFGRNIGINLNAVRAYATQLFTSLKHLRNCGVLHCDIKPDNMLVNESKKVLKVCDFGSAMFAGENEITPYLVSRFYRAPEIILGLPYDHALDIWSVGCCLYELYTGKMLFPGHTNNDMLRLHMELKGSFPKKMLKKAAFADQHFDQDFNFCAIEEDPVTKKAIKRILVNIKPRDMGILVSGSGNMDEDSKMIASFKDLLEKIFILDPDKRLTVSQALCHSFISGK